MRFVVVLVLSSAATDISEWSICCEDDQGVIDSTEIRQLCILKIVVSLQIEGIASNVGLPFLRYFVKGFLSGVSLHIVIVARWLSCCLDMLERSSHCILELLQCVQDVEAESSLDCFC